jgi:hypothetical protein
VCMCIPLVLFKFYLEIEVCSSIRSAAKKYQIAVNTLRGSYLDKDRLYKHTYYFSTE